MREVIKLLEDRREKYDWPPDEQLDEAIRLLRVAAAIKDTTGPGRYGHILVKRMEENALPEA